jgi:cytochrome c553
MKHQWGTYLTNALKARQTGTRHNDPGRLMTSVAARLTNADIEAVAQYYSSLAP